MQEVLKLYSKELPAMNYAANTGKESMFLERCIANGYGAFPFLFLDVILTISKFGGFPSFIHIRISDTALCFELITPLFLILGLLMNYYHQF